VSQRFYIETLGCPKNQVDSDKLVGTLVADGLTPASSADDADLVVVNTCAFVEEARQESIDVVLALGDARKDGARLVVTGCMAERYGDELAAALPEVDAVVGFGVPVTPVVLGQASDALASELDPHQDQQATPAMRRHLAKVLLGRCVATLLNRSDLHAGGAA